MPEYMDYNGTDEVVTKGKKIRSAIVMCFCVAWLAFLVIWVIVKAPGNTRTRFAACYTPETSFSNPVKTDTDSEFYQLKAALDAVETGQSIPFDSAFQKAYPKTASLFLKDTKDLAKGAPYQFDMPGCLGLASVSVVTSNNAQNAPTTLTEGVRSIDFLLVPYETKIDSSAPSVTVTVQAPVRFSLQYDYTNALSPVVRPATLNAKNYRLNMYSMSLRFKIQQAVGQLDYTAALSVPLIKKNVDDEDFIKNVYLQGGGRGTLQSGGQISDKSVGVRLPLQKKADGDNTPGDNTVVFEWNDVAYNKLQSFSVTAQLPAGTAPAGSFILQLN